MTEATEAVRLVDTPQGDLNRLTNILENNELPQERIKLGPIEGPYHSNAMQPVYCDPFGNLYRYDRANNELVLVRKFKRPYA